MRPEVKNRSAAPAGGARAGLSLKFKEKCRRALANGLYYTGLLQVARRLEASHEVRAVSGARLPRLRRFSGPKFGILCYHRVGTEGVPLYSRLQPAVFEAQMRYVREHYRIVSLGQLCLELQEARPAEPALAVTFDDGYRDLYTHAYPVLQKYKIPATIYLIGRCMETGVAPWYDRIFAALQAAPGAILDVELDRPRSFALSSQGSRNAAAWEIICYLRTIADERRWAWCADFERCVPVPEQQVRGRMLDWQQVREMHRGGIHFGAHTMTHPAVSRLDPAAFAEELALSKKFLESGLDAAVEDFAYPFGKDSDRSGLAETYLRSMGYRSAVTTVDGYNAAGANLFDLHRKQIGDDRSLANFAFDLARMFLESESNSPSAAVNDAGYGSQAAGAQASRSSL